MKHTHILVFLLMASLLAFISGVVLVYPDLVGLCPQGARSCIYSFPVFSVGEPLLFGAIPLFITFLILLFLRKETYDTWKKFAIVYLPLAFILIFTTPVSSGFLQMDRELMSLWTAGIFLVISLGIIAYKAWKLREVVITDEDLKAMEEAGEAGEDEEEEER